jgi:NADH-quinone oxidoreductase subunit M
MNALEKNREASLIFSMAQHSLVIMFLFALVDVIEKRFGSRTMNDIELSNKSLGSLRKFMLFGIISLIGSPFTPGFISEIVSIYSVSNISIFHAVVVGLTILVMSFIAFNMYNSIFKQKAATEGVIELNQKETFGLLLMAICILSIGTFPRLFGKC